MSSEAGNVASITPTCCRPSGRVASALSSANSWPVSAETVAMMVRLVMTVAWQRVRTRTLRRCGVRIMGGQSGGNGSGTQPPQAVDRYASENGGTTVGLAAVSCFPTGNWAVENAMTEKTHARLVTDQFGPRAAAYIASSVHAQGEDLDALEAVVAGQSGAQLLDLGCGGGHVSFRVAPHVAQ